MSNRKLGIDDKQFESLQRQTVQTDKTADDLGVEPKVGTIESLEERHGPSWLRRRRRDQRLGRPVQRLVSDDED